MSGQRALKGAGAAGGAPSGLVIVDKPSGLTSHDVVARIRRLAGTRRVGHAGTLDPMATGVLVIGVEQATRMLGHLALTQKQYRGTIRLGQATDTDDAEGQITARASAAGVTPRGAARRDRRADRRDTAGPAGDQRDQGRRPARLPADPRGRAARAGRPAGHGQRAGHPRHPPEHRPGGEELLDVDVDVTCSSGTYIRAIARDLGAALGTGGHLTALRRTRVGPYQVGDAATLDELAQELRVIPLAEAAGAAFARRDLTDDEARRVGHGARLPAVGAGAGPVAAFAPDGTLVALLTEESGQARSLAVFVS